MTLERVADMAGIRKADFLFIEPFSEALALLALTAIGALAPWGIFYLIRWVVRGFSNHVGPNPSS